MGQNNGNNPPKVDLELNQEARFRILKPVHQGESSYGKFYLYAVSDLDTGEARSFFAPEEIHNIITEKRLGVGSQFILKRVQNGSKKASFQLEIPAVVGKPMDHPAPIDDNLKELLLGSIRDAVEIVKESGVQFGNDEIQKLATTLFIQRVRIQ